MAHELDMSIGRPAIAFRGALDRLIAAAHTASELMDGCPDDDVMAAASTELSNAAAAADIECTAVDELIRSARSVCASGSDATLRMAIAQLDKSLTRCLGGSDESQG